MATPITVAAALSQKIGIIFHLAAAAGKGTMSFVRRGVIVDGGFFFTIVFLSYFGRSDRCRLKVAPVLSPEAN